MGQKLIMELKNAIIAQGVAMLTLRGWKGRNKLLRDMSLSLQKICLFGSQKGGAIVYMSILSTAGCDTGMWPDDLSFYWDSSGCLGQRAYSEEGVPDQP